jgi:hypothetical protein
MWCLALMLPLLMRPRIQALIIDRHSIDHVDQLSESRDRYISSEPACNQSKPDGEQVR